MTQDQAVVIAFVVVTVAGVVAVALFVLTYTYMSQWWKNPIGRTVVDFAIRVAVASIPPILSLVFHFNRTTSQVGGWFDVALFAWAAVGMFRRIPLWVKLHLDKGGQKTYTGLLSFLAEVVRRRGRPIWRDWPQPGADEDAEVPGTGL